MNKVNMNYSNKAEISKTFKFGSNLKTQKLELNILIDGGLLNFYSRAY